MRKITFIFLIINILYFLISIDLLALDYPHNWEKAIQCSSCHRVKNAPGGKLTLVGGNVNLCKYCHNSSGSASRFNLEYSDQGLPGSSGTSHGFEKAAINSGYDATEPTDGNMYLRLENGNIVCSTCHAVHNHNISFPFLWSTRDQICSKCHSAREQSSPPYTSHPVKVSIPANPDYKTPTDLELLNNKVECLSCHSIHYTYSKTQYRGRAESGTTTCLTDNDATWTPDALVGWELKILITSNPNKHNWYQRRVITSNTNNTICWNDALPDPVVANDPYVIKDVGSGDGYLLNQSKENLCTQCHAFPLTGTHFTNSNSRWPGGQYGSDYAYTNASGSEIYPQARKNDAGVLKNQPVPSFLSNNCYDCHWPHGWKDASSTTYPKLNIEYEEKLCYTCHDGSPATTNVMTHFETTNWVNKPVGKWSNTNINNHHDVKTADQSVSGAKVECVNCHDPHKLSGANPPMSRLIPDPDPNDGRVPTPGNSWTGSDFQSEWCLDCHDGSYPPDVNPPTNPLMNILDSYTSGGSYGPDVHGTKTGNPTLKSGYGWAKGDTIPCTACHDPKHQSTNFFQLVPKVKSKDGTTDIPADSSRCGPDVYTYNVTDINTTNVKIDGYCWCNTCHTGSMGSNKINCFQSGCHHHANKL